MTFDKQFYDFAGECSYLLTSDFVNSKFSAIVNYEIHVGFHLYFDRKYPICPIRHKITVSLMKYPTLPQNISKCILLSLAEP